jgi:hypothetical protein
VSVASLCCACGWCWCGCECWCAAHSEALVLSSCLIDIIHGACLAHVLGTNGGSIGSVVDMVTNRGQRRHDIDDNYTWTSTERQHHITAAHTHTHSTGGVNSRRSRPVETGSEQVQVRSRRSRPVETGSEQAQVRSRQARNRLGTGSEQARNRLALDRPVLSLSRPPRPVSTVRSLFRACLDRSRLSRHVS